MIDEKPIGESSFTVMLWRGEHTHVVLEKPLDIRLGDVDFHLEPAEKDTTSCHLSFPANNIRHAIEKIETIKKVEFKELARILFLDGIVLEIKSWGVGARFFNPITKLYTICSQLGISWDMLDMPVPFLEKKFTDTYKMYLKTLDDKYNLAHHVLGLLVEPSDGKSLDFRDVWTAFNCIYTFHKKNMKGQKEKHSKTAMRYKVFGNEQKKIYMFAKSFSNYEDGYNILEKHSSTVKLLCGDKSNQQKHDVVLTCKNTADTLDIWWPIFLRIYRMLNKISHEGVPSKDLDSASKLLQDVIRAYLKNLIWDDSQENLPV